MSDESNPAKKSFDCVAFQRAQRKKLGKKFENMSGEEIGAWMRNYLPTDPKLRRLVERLRARDARARDEPSPGPRPLGTTDGTHGHRNAAGSRQGTDLQRVRTE